MGYTLSAGPVIRDGQVFCALSQVRGYPVAELWKPMIIRDTRDRPKFAANALMWEFLRQIDEKTVPQTAEEVAQHRPLAWGGSVSTSATIEQPSEWKHARAFWVRVVEGPNSHCWINSRVGAHALWRDPLFYCGDGPTTYEAWKSDELATGTETYKPVVSIFFAGVEYALSLLRYMTPPRGDIWTWHTGAQSWALCTGGKFVEFERTKAELKRQVYKAFGIGAGIPKGP